MNSRRLILSCMILCAGLPACINNPTNSGGDPALLSAFAAFQTAALPGTAGQANDYSMQVRDLRGERRFAFQTTATIDVRVNLSSAGDAASENIIRFREIENGTPGPVVFQARTDASGDVRGNFTVNTTVTSVDLEFMANGRSYRVPIELSELLSIDRVITMRASEQRSNAPGASGFLQYLAGVGATALPDADGDGVPDSIDHFPNDPDLATRLLFPSRGRYTVAYEDLYPVKGDADFNDYVVQVRHVEELNANGEVVRLRASYRHAARAAGYKHVLKLNLPGVADAEYTLKRTSADGEVISEESQRVAQFSDVSVTARSDRTIGQTNAHPGQNFEPGDLFELEVIPDLPVSKAELGGAPYDLYLYVQNTRREVHFAGRETDAQGQDPYLDEDGFPWALLVPVDWRWMYERKSIHAAYEFFDDWYESGGRTNRDWYNSPDISLVFENVTTSISPQPAFSPPPGFNPADFVIEESMLPLPHRFAEYWVPIGRIYDIRPVTGGGIVFPGEAARITYTYDRAALKDAGFEEEFAAFYYDADAATWVNLPRVESDPTTNTVSVFTDHLTPFVLTALPSGGGQVPVGPACLADDYPAGIGGSAGASFSSVDFNFRYYQDRNYEVENAAVSPDNATTFAALGFENALGIATCNGGGACGPTAQHKHYAGDDYINFTAHANLDVYVMYDSRAGAGGEADWLRTAPWVNTGYRITTTDPVPYYSVFQRSYNAGETVALHGNRRGSAGSVQTNYWVVIKLQGDTTNSGASATCIATPDTTPPANVTGLTGAPGATQTLLSWNNPGDLDFAGVVIRRDTAGPPQRVRDGQAPTGTVLGPNSFRDDSVNVGTTYHYTVFALDANNNRLEPGASITLTTSADSDGDGLSDIFENTTDYSLLFPGSPAPDFTCATAPCGSGDPRDTDGDGVSDAQEFGASTDPTNPDTARPTVTLFAATSATPTTNPTVNFNLNGSDDVAVTGWKITLSATKPLPGDAGWQPTIPTDFMLSAPGNYTLYAWARDLAGNVSDAFTPIAIELQAPPPVHSGANWTQATADFQFSDRYNKIVVTKGDTVFVIGGIARGTNQYLRDVWASTDGTTWTQRTANFPMSDRYAPLAVLVHNDRIWIIGGFARGTNATLQDVWSTADGVTWTQATANFGLPFQRYDERQGSDSPSTLHSFVLNGRMYIMGGRARGTNQYLRDVWSSADGATWTQETGDFQFPSRYDPLLALVHNGRFYIAGGRAPSTNAYLRDVWSTADGATWTQETANFGLSDRYDDPCQRRLFAWSMNGRMYLMGGLARSTNQYRRDVWSSADGATWIQNTADFQFSDRYSPILARVYGGRFFVVGGRARSTNAFLQDVWSTADGTTWTQATASTGIPLRQDGSGSCSGIGSQQTVLHSFVLDNSMMILGGFPAGSGNYLRDVWKSVAP